MGNLGGAFLKSFVLTYDSRGGRVLFECGVRYNYRLMLYYLLVGLYLVVCLLLLLVVLMQQGKGGDMASAFGGGGSSQTAFGARAGATVLTRATTVLGALFMIGAILLGVYGSHGPSSVLSGVKGPAAPAPAPVAPAQPGK
jgi:preprotein translocase subunit SecG